MCLQHYQERSREEEGEEDKDVPTDTKKTISLKKEELVQHIVERHYEIEIDGKRIQYYKYQKVLEGLDSDYDADEDFLTIEDQKAYDELSEEKKEEFNDFVIELSILHDNSPEESDTLN